MIQGFTLDGLVPPLQVTPTDHEGGGWVQIFQVKGEGMVKETEWFQGYRDLVLRTVNAGYSSGFTTGPVGPGGRPGHARKQGRDQRCDV